MAFPKTVLPLVTELLIGGVWTDVTADRRIAGGLTIDRGRGDWGTQIDSSQCEQVFQNADGKYSNRNPASPYYGLIGRNTQLRHRIRWAYAPFTASTSSAWPAADTGQTWANSGGAASDYSSSGGFGRHAHTSVNVFRSSTVELGATDQDVTVDVKFDIGTATGASVGHWVAVRSADLSNYYTARLFLTTAGDLSLSLLKRVAGALTAIDGGAVTVGTGHVGGDWWRIRVSVRGNRVRCMAWKRDTGLAPDDWQISVTDAELTAGTRAVLLSRLEAGNTNTLDVTASWDNFEYNSFRFWGETTAWESAWDYSGRNVTALVKAFGIIKRLRNGTPPSLSAMRRTILANNPTIYYPLEDESGTTQFASALSGVPAVTGTLFGSGEVKAAQLSDLPGSAPLPELTQGAEIRVSVPDYADTGVLAFHWSVFTDSTHSHGVDLRATMANGAYGAVTFIPYESTPLIFLSVVDAEGNSLISEVDPFTSLADCVGWIQVELVGVLSTGRWTMRLRSQDGTVLRSLTNTGGAAGYGTVRTIMVTAVDGGAPADGDTLTVGVGHVQQYGYDTSASGGGTHFASTALATASAMAGHTGERGAVRLDRLCEQNGIAFDLVGAADDTEPMGPQGVKTLPDLLFECADADQGRLFEPRDMFGLGYHTRRSLYNQTPVALDYAAGHIGGTFQPPADDQLVKNDVTVKRPNGSWGRFEVTTGPLSTQAPPDGIGTYPISPELNLYGDDRAYPFAAWIAHLGTWDEERYATVTVPMAAPDVVADGLIPSVERLDIGDTLTVANPPSWQPPDDIGLMVEGSSEFIGDGKDWAITFLTVPSGPYNVGVWSASRWDSGSTTLAADFDAGTDTSMSVNVGDGILWSHADGDFDINAGGVRLTVLGTAGVASPQTLIVNATPVNGIIKTIPAGTPVRLWDSAVWGL